MNKDPREIMLNGSNYERRQWLWRSGLSYVYFIEATGTDTIKIGTAGDPIGRMHDLQCGCPHKLSLLLVLAGDREREQHYHTTWNEHRIRGEWFRLDREILDYLNSKKSVHPFTCVVDDSRELRRLACV